MARPALVPVHETDTVRFFEAVADVESFFLRVEIVNKLRVLDDEHEFRARALET